MKNFFSLLSRVLKAKVFLVSLAAILIVSGFFVVYGVQAASNTTPPIVKNFNTYRNIASNLEQVKNDVSKININQNIKVDQKKDDVNNIKNGNFNILEQADQLKNIPGPVLNENYVPGEILVKYKSNRINLETVRGRNTALNFIRSKSLEKKEDFRNINTSVLKIKDNKTVEEKIAELRNDQNVEYAQPNFQYYPTDINTNDTNRGLLWGLNNTGQTVNEVSGTNDADIDAPEAWAISEATTSATVIVAVIDSGVAYNHPDLSANMWDGTNCKDENGDNLGNCNHGYDYEDDDRTPLPTNSSHGTHIAGTIVAIKNNEKGIIGVAPQAKIMALKSSLTTDEIIQAINFAEQNDAKIINASWGCLGGDWGGTHAVCGDDNDYRDQVMINAIAAFPGLFITAAGNGNGDSDPEGDNHDAGETHHFYPCDHTAPNIICVAATDQNDALATFSDYGTTSVDVGAPGVNIYSTIADSEVFNETFEEVETPNIPNDWSTGGANNNWGTYDLEGAWGKVLYGDLFNGHRNSYLPNADSVAVSPTYNLGGNTGATMNFYTSCDTEYSVDYYYDYMALEVSSDGTNFTEILRWNEAGLDSLNDDSDPSGSAWYYIENLSLPNQYLTDNFKFRFKWHTDANNYPDIDYDGCFVDDINIIKYSDGSDERYAYIDGTSMATPHVAGLAGLIWGYSPDLSVTEVKDVILSTGDNKESLSGKTVTGKRINAYNALNSLVPENHIISGTVIYYNGEKLVSNAIVILEDDNENQLMATSTNAVGYYEFNNLEDGNNYVIRVEKDDNNPINGVNGLDLTKIVRNIVGLEIFNSIYKIIAADVNEDYTIVGTDLTRIVRYIVGLNDTLPSGGWKFYSSNANLSEGNYLTEGLNRIYTNLTTDVTNQNFIGVKMGDVNDSWSND